METPEHRAVRLSKRRERDRKRRRRAAAASTLPATHIKAEPSSTRNYATASTGFQFNTGFANTSRANNLRVAAAQAERRDQRNAPLQSAWSASTNASTPSHTELRAEGELVAQSVASDAPPQLNEFHSWSCPVIKREPLDDDSVDAVRALLTWVADVIEMQK